MCSSGPDRKFPLTNEHFIFAATVAIAIGAPVGEGELRVESVVLSHEQRDSQVESRTYQVGLFSVAFPHDVSIDRPLQSSHEYPSAAGNL